MIAFLLENCPQAIKWKSRFFVFFGWNSGFETVFLLIIVSLLIASPLTDNCLINNE
jgi:hypothetical protein